MSRDCGRPSRRRAGSGCSPTSPRVGGESECLGLAAGLVGSGPQGACGGAGRVDNWLQQAVGGRPQPSGPDSVILTSTAAWPFSQPWTWPCPLSSKALRVSCFLPSGRFWNRPSDFFPLRLSQQTSYQGSSPQSSDPPSDFPGMRLPDKI